MPRRLSPAYLRAFRNRLMRAMRPAEVESIFDDLLGRAPTETELKEARGRPNGASLVDLITGSDEYRERRRRLDADGLDLVYQRLLARPATDAEQTYALEKGLTFESALHLVTNSSEYLSQRPLAALLQPDDTSGNRDTDDYDALLAESAIGGEELDALVALVGDRDIELGAKSRTYLRDHRLRFVELLGLVEVLHRAAPFRRVAEIGPTKFLATILAELTGAEIVTVERPTADGGRDGAWAAAAGVAHHVNLDLNTTSLPDVLPPELRRSCDLVLCGEVVEHLFADPAEIIGDVLELVAPGGVLVVTTPNYLGLRSLRAMEKGLNPASRFSRSEGNVDAHYHLREYTMSELEDAAVAAGGRVELAAFSACWDEGDQIVEQWSNRQVRGNLVIVVSRAGDDAANAVQRWRRARGA
jgi:hypothetical protein